MPSIKDILAGKVTSASHGDKLNIDYPQAGEVVSRGHYAIRVSTGAGECQVAVDDGPWQDCRCGEGFSWYDWSPEQVGSHRISARTRVGNKWIKATRTCKVK